MTEIVDGIDKIANQIYSAIKKNKLSRSGFSRDLAQIYTAGYRQSQKEFLDRLKEYREAGNATEQDTSAGDNASGVGREPHSDFPPGGPRVAASDGDWGPGSDELLGSTSST